jgi:hypothetical protein
MKQAVKKIRGYEFEWHTDKELLDIFPEIKTIIPAKISELKATIKEEEKGILKKLNQIKELQTDDFSKWFYREIVGMEFMPKLMAYDRELSRFKRYSQILNPSKKYIPNFQEKIETAKNYPIYEIASRYVELRQSGNNYTGLCPFHNEKHASFYIYTESNTYHCFGCQAHGSVINLTMELHGVDFKNAVEILQK